MEPRDTEQLVNARARLKRQVEILVSGRSKGSPEAIITKLRSQLSEIDELLESEGIASPERDLANQLRPEDLLEPNDLQCIGCTKSPSDVRLLLAGPSWAICDECLSCLVTIGAEANREWRRELIKALEELDSK